MKAMKRHCRRGARDGTHARLAPAGSPAADASPALLFKSMAEDLPGLAGLTLAKLGDGGVALPGAAAARREVEV